MPPALAGPASSPSTTSAPADGLPGRLRHLRPIGGIEQIEGIVEVLRITAELGQIYGQALQQGAVG